MGRNVPVWAARLPWTDLKVRGHCQFGSISESCTFFVTTVEFKPTLQRQREDAEAKGQLGRQRIFEGLLDRLDQEAG